MEKDTQLTSAHTLLQVFMVEKTTAPPFACLRSSLGVPVQAFRGLSSIDSSKSLTKPVYVHPSKHAIVAWPRLVTFRPNFRSRKIHFSIESTVPFWHGKEDAHTFDFDLDVMAICFQHGRCEGSSERFCADQGSHGGKFSYSLSPIGHGQ